MTAHNAVLDASALAKRLAPGGPHGDAFNDWLDAALNANVDLLAPHLLRYELGNILARAAAHDPGLTAARRAESLVHVLLGVRFVDGADIEEFAPPLTYYDGAYLAAARATGAPLITYDGALAGAAAAAGIDVVSPL